MNRLKMLAGVTALSRLQPVNDPSTLPQQRMANQLCVKPYQDWHGLTRQELGKKNDQVIRKAGAAHLFAPEFLAELTGTRPPVTLITPSFNDPNFKSPPLALGPFQVFKNYEGGDEPDVIIYADLHNLKGLETAFLEDHISRLPKGSEVNVFHEAWPSNSMIRKLPTCTLFIHPLEKEYRQPMIEELEPKLRNILNGMPHLTKEVKNNIKNMNVTDLMYFLETSDDVQLMSLYKAFHNVFIKYGKKSVFGRNLEWGKSVYNTMKRLDPGKLTTPILVIGGGGHFELESYRNAFLLESGWGDKKIQMVVPSKYFIDPELSLTGKTPEEITEVRVYYDQKCGVGAKRV